MVEIKEIQKRHQIKCSLTLDGCEKFYKYSGWFLTICLKL